MTALIDTGFMLAIISANDRRHRDCAIALEQEPDPLLPSVILTELAYMVVRDVGRGTFVQFMRSVLSGEIKLVFPTTADIERAIELFEQ